MAQPLIRSFVAELATKIELPDPVVEFGAMQVEAGQDGDLRPLFAGRAFVGTDFRVGPGVDRVEDLRRLTFADGEVGTALCLDTLEHCEDPPQGCRELARATSRDGGVCVISSVMLFGIHGYPNDYFRFTPEGFRAMLSGFGAAWVAGVGHPDIPTQVIGVGVHGRALELAFKDFACLTEAQRHWTERRGKVRLGVHNFPPADVVRALRSEVPRLMRERFKRG